MSEKRVTVWVTRFHDRTNLMLQWIDPDTGARKSKSAQTSNARLAETKRSELEYELNHGLHQEASRMSWEKLRELFEAEYYPNCRPGTIAAFESVFDSVEEMCKPTSLRTITERTISRFKAALLRRPGRGADGKMSPSTVKLRLQSLHTILNWAAKQKFIPECPAFPEVRVPKLKPRPVAIEAFERLLDRADQQMKVYLWTGWLAGLRRNEALYLEWDESHEWPWVDLDRDRIWLPAGFVKAVEDQWVPLDPDLREMLLTLPRHGKNVFNFISRRTREPVTPRGLSSTINYLAKVAGVRLSMKSLRKAFGSRYAGSVPAQVLQKLMRHSSIRVTMDYYANVDEAVEEAVFRGRRNTSRNSAVPKESRTGSENAASSNQEGGLGGSKGGTT
jgi:integrase